MTDWQPIEKAPRDGTVILAFIPGGVEVDNHTYTWPEGTMIEVVPVRWHTPNTRTSEACGWYPPFFWLSFGVWDDPSTDIDAIKVEPTHWMPMPVPPHQR